MEEISRKHQLLSEYFQKNMPGCRVIPSDSSYFAWIDLRSLKIRPQMLSHQIEQETHMLVENGYPLGKGGAGFVRLNLASPDNYLEDGAARLREFYLQHIR